MPATSKRYACLPDDRPAHYTRDQTQPNLRIAQADFLEKRETANRVRDRIETIIAKNGDVDAQRFMTSLRGAAGRSSRGTKGAPGIFQAVYSGVITRQQQAALLPDGALPRARKVCRAERSQSTRERCLHAATRFEITHIPVRDRS